MAFTSFTALLPESLKEKLGIRPKKIPNQSGQQSPKRPLAPANADNSSSFNTSILSPILHTEVFWITYFSIIRYRVCNKLTLCDWLTLNTGTVPYTRIVNILCVADLRSGIRFFFTSWIRNDFFLDPGSLPHLKIQFRFVKSESLNVLYL
jgi:hypothetical protein